MYKPQEAYKAIETLYAILSKYNCTIRWEHNLAYLDGLKDVLPHDHENLLNVGAVWDPILERWTFYMPLDSNKTGEA